MNLLLYQEMAHDTDVGKQAKEWMNLHWHEWVKVVGSDRLAKKVAVDVVWGFGFLGWKSGQQATKEWQSSNFSAMGCGVVGPRSCSTEPANVDDADECLESGSSGSNGGGSSGSGGAVMTSIGMVPRVYEEFDRWINRCLLELNV